MTDTTKNIKKAGITLGILALSFDTMEGQSNSSYNLNKDKGYNYNNSCLFAPFERYDRKFPTIKLGATYNIIRREKQSDEKANFFERGPGVEVLLEDELKKRIFVELAVGMCALYDYEARNGALHYSEVHADIGLGYKPVIRDGWAIAVKSGAGVSDEFYKEAVGSRTEKIHLNALVESGVEKIFDNGLGFGIAVSREMNRDYWRMGARFIVKPVDRKQHIHHNRKYSR